MSEAMDSAEKKKVDDAPRAPHASDAAYDSLLDSLPLNVIRKDRQGRVVFGNERYCQTMNSTLEELIGKTDFDLFPPDLAKKYTEDDKKVFETGETLNDIEEHQTPDGESIFVEILKGPVRDAEGRVVGIQILFWDVTDRRRAEVALENERYLLHTLLNNVPDSIYFKDLESRFIKVSKSMAEKFGHQKAEDVIGKTDADFFSEEHAQQAMHDEQKLIRSEESIVGQEEKETWIDAPDTWCSTTKLPLRDKDGNIIGTFGISSDITDRKRAEEALARERDMLRTLMDHLPDLIFVKDDEGRFVTANLAILKALGAESLQNLVGKTDFDFFPKDLAEHYSQDDQAVIQSGEPLIDREESIVESNGKESWLLTTKVPLRDAAGKVTGLVGIGRNITTRKRAEEALRGAKEAADAANRAKSDFLANMSHEIRTPMNAILGMTELMLDTELTPVQRDYLTMVQESGESLLELINEILDYSKIEAGKLELDHAVFPLRESIGNTMKSLAFRGHGKGLELAFRVHPEVPDLLVGDLGRFRQIVVNLVGNAIKFTEHGEVVLEINYASNSDDKAVLHCSVTDTGIGIPPEKCEKIFEKFEQADTSTTRNYGGTGLGLTISSKLVGLMSGRIWVESEAGQGSTFHFTARFDVADESPLEIERLEPVVLGDTPILVVDDNATNRTILEEMVRNFGMKPETVSSAHEAIQKLREACNQGNPFSLILSDVHMPEVDGFTLAEWIRQDESLAEAEIIMLTSGGRPGDRERRSKLGISANLIKPVKQSELFDTIARVLGITAAEDDGEEAATSEQPVHVTPLHILLAEDSLVNQKLAIAVLEQQGHHITVANNGKEAVDAVKSDDFDLVLMDVQMPEMDGLEATRTIRRHERNTGEHIAIIAMTAHAMKGDRERCLESGMDGYIPKPVRAKELFETLARIAPSFTKAQEAERELPNRDKVDWNSTLDRVGGNQQALKEVVQLFREVECPKLLREIRQALAEDDTILLQRAAHTLKGLLELFTAKRAFELARTLETMAREENVRDADPLRISLEKEISHLMSEFEAFGKE